MLLEFQRPVCIVLGDLLQLVIRLVAEDPDLVDPIYVLRADPALRRQVLDALLVARTSIGDAS